MAHLMTVSHFLWKKLDFFRTISNIEIRNLLPTSRGKLSFSSLRAEDDTKL